jgi:methylmalonyl-CoA mutase
MRTIGDIIEYTAQNMPKFNSGSQSRVTTQEAAFVQALELASRWQTAKSMLKTALAKA